MTNLRYIYIRESESACIEVRGELVKSQERRESRVESKVRKSGTVCKSAIPVKIVSPIKIMAIGKL